MTQEPAPLIVVSDPIHPDGIEMLRQLGTVRAHSYSNKTADRSELFVDLAEADVMVLRAMPITAELLDGCPKLKLIARHGIGIDHIDLGAATERGIVVTNTGEISSVAVAEAAVTLMMATLRRVPEMQAAVLDERFVSNWQFDHWTVLLGSMSDRKLGLVGFGNIARNVARMCARGFDMEVSAYDPYVSEAEMAALGVKKVEFEDLIRDSDILSVHAPRARDTKYMIGEKQFAMMKKDAILVHTSRGGVVDEAALHVALRDGLIAGAGLDVYENEPPRAANPLFHLNNVVLSPHVGAATSASRRGVAQQIAEIVEQVWKGEKPKTLLNVDVWERRRR